MAKNPDMVEPQGQKVVDGGKGAKSNDQFESARESGDVGSASLPKTEACCKDQNTPYGQIVK